MFKHSWHVWPWIDWISLMVGRKASIQNKTTSSASILWGFIVVVKLIKMVLFVFRPTIRLYSLLNVRLFSLSALIMTYRRPLLRATYEVIQLHPSSILWQKKFYLLRYLNLVPLHPESSVLPLDQGVNFVRSSIRHEYTLIYSLWCTHTCWVWWITTLQLLFIHNEPHL